MADSTKFLLTVEPIWTPPALRRVAPGRWPGIRKSLLRERGPICEICGFAAEEPRYIDAHEVFEYPDDGTIRLAGIQLLCKRCHDCKHFDQLLSMEKDGIRDAGRAETVIEHFCGVKGCSRAEFEDNLEASRRRSEELRRRYGSDVPADQVDYGPYDEIVSRSRRPGSPLNWWHVMQRIKKYAREGRFTVDGGNVFDHHDYDEIVNALRYDDNTRGEIVRLGNAQDWRGAYAAIVALMEEMMDYDDGELFPDHECPEDTHMWREMFRND
jgi:hypothetical protein